MEENVVLILNEDGVNRNPPGKFPGRSLFGNNGFETASNNGFNVDPSDHGNEIKAPRESTEPTLKCYEYLTLRGQYSRAKKMKKALNNSNEDTPVDVTMTILDISDIDAVQGEFKVKFKLHSIYKFDMKQKTGSVCNACFYTIYCFF